MTTRSVARWAEGRGQSAPCSTAVPSASGSSGRVPATASRGSKPAGPVTAGPSSWWAIGQVPNWRNGVAADPAHPGCPAANQLSV